MENKMNYTKAVILLVSGIVALAASFWLGAAHRAYGFLLGYGCAALAGGALGIGYTFFKNAQAKKEAAS